MHNLTKIKIFRTLLQITYLPSLLLIYPLVRLKARSRSRIFFFFDRYAIGGAQKVHLDILKSIEDLPKTIYFTRKSPNDKLKDDFYRFPNVVCYDIHFWCDNLLFRLFTVHYYAFLLNAHQDVRVLGANSTFFYDMLPFLKKDVTKMELLHNFSFQKSGMEFFGLANHQYLDKRLVIDDVTYGNIVNQYRGYSVSEAFFSRLQVIEFGVDIPGNIIKPKVPPLKVLYAGRGTAQKRIPLLNKIVEHFIGSGDIVEFTFAGSMGPELSPAVIAHSKVYAEIGDSKKMNDLFAASHVIILTSAFEGFPVVIKEGMAFGCVPVATGLPGIKIHLRHQQNALLMDNHENEDSVVNHAIEYITLLANDRQLLHRLSAEAYSYAVARFSKASFLQAYRALLS